MEKMWLAMYVYGVDGISFNTLYLHYSYTHYTLHYTSIHLIQCIHILYKHVIYYMLLTNAYANIKVKHNTIAYNTQIKVLNKRIC